LDTVAALPAECCGKLSLLHPREVVPAKQTPWQMI